MRLLLTTLLLSFGASATFAAAPSSVVSAPPQAALARELAPKLNRFREVWDRCPDARLRGPATAAFRRWIAESLHAAGDKKARRQWLRDLPALDARALGPDAGGSLVVVVPKACALPVTPWAVSTLLGAPAEPEDLLAGAVADTLEPSASVVGTNVPSTLYAALDTASLLALGREGKVAKPFPVWSAPEAAAPVAKKNGAIVVRLTVAPGAAAGPEREFRPEGDHWRWVSATALAGVGTSAEVPEHWLPIADLVASAATVTDVKAWQNLAKAFATILPLPNEARRLVEAASRSGLSEMSRRALAALGQDGAPIVDLEALDAVEAIEPVVGLDETLDRRIVQRLLPMWLVTKPITAAWMERIAKAHPDAILDGWSPSILDDDARLAAAWVGTGAMRKTLVERAATRELPEASLRRIGEVARLDREPTVRATTAALDYAMCVRQSAAGLAARCGLYGVMLSLLADPDARVRYAAAEQVRYRADVRGHRFSSPAEWRALLAPLPKGPGDIAKVLPLLKSSGDEESFGRWARTPEGREWIGEVTASDASGADELRRWVLAGLGPLSPPPTQAAAGIPQRSAGGAPTEFAALAAKVASVTEPAREPVRQPAAVEPTISTIDKVVDLSDSPDAAEAQKGKDETPETPLMPAAPK